MAGDFIFLTQNEFNKFVLHKLNTSSETYQNLKSKQLVADSKEEILRNIDMTATRYRSKKGFLKDFTALHMMVITVRCNQKCRYCQVSCEDETAKQYDMTPEIAHHIIDFIFKTPSDSIKIEFQGGEPLLNWNTIENSVLYAENQNRKYNKKLEFVICSNITSDIKCRLSFIKEHNITISSSLDGSEEIHNKCRVYKNKSGTYDKFIENLQLCREVCGKDSIDALMTTTTYSLDKIENIIDEYITNGFDGIFLRALNPYGFAEENKKEIGYSADDFFSMYKKAIEYILNVNKMGKFFTERYTALLLSRILTPFPTGFVDLQSPSGAGISGVIYDYNGDIYPADEARMMARMGNKYFLMGNVQTNTYEEVFKSSVIRKIVSESCLEIMPHCAQCVFAPYCGADPIRNYLETNDIMGDRLHSDFCKKKSYFPIFV